MVEMPYLSYSLRFRCGGFGIIGSVSVCAVVFVNLSFRKSVSGALIRAFNFTGILT